MSNGITREEVANGIPAEYRTFFRLAVASPLNRTTVLPMVEAFWRSTRLICPRARTLPTLHVLFAPSPFRIPLANGHLTFEPSTDVVNVTVENIVFLDTNKMATIPQHELASYVLHELVHAIFNISDENLVVALTADLIANSPE